MTRVSVCMATYNGERFVSKQLISILSQLSPDDEIIISDDSSTDNTIDIISGFNDPRIIILKNQSFNSPLLNFENALRHATGNYIFLSDQDDVWEQNKINVIVSLLNSYDLVLADCQVVDDEGNILSKSFFEHRGSRPGFWYNLYKNSYIGCCMAFRREVLLYTLPIPVQAVWHDWWIGLLVEIKGKIHFYNRPLICHVRHGGNNSPTGEKGYRLDKRLYMRLSIFWQIVKRMAYNQ